MNFNHDCMLDSESVQLAASPSPECALPRKQKNRYDLCSPEFFHRWHVGHTPMSIRLLSATLTVLVLSHGDAFSQNWPNRTVRLIVPFPAGGAVDVVARTVFDKVSAQLGQPFVIENRLGAGGTIGS